MKIRYRSAAATMMIAAMLLASPLAADSGGGSSTTEETSSNDMTYITIGLAVLVGGYLIYDAIADSGEQPVADAGSTGIIDTGVDWDHAVSQGGDEVTTVAVSIIPGPDGNQLSMQLIGALREMVGEAVDIYEDPIDLGSGPEIQRAALAREFFGVDYLVFQAAGPDSMVTFGVASPDSVVWTSTDQSGNSMLVVASEILQSGIF